MLNQSYVTKQDVAKAGLWKDKSPLLGRLDIEMTELSIFVSSVLYTLI